MNVFIACAAAAALVVVIWHGFYVLDQPRETLAYTFASMALVSALVAVIVWAIVSEYMKGAL